MYRRVKKILETALAEKINLTSFGRISTLPYTSDAFCVVLEQPKNKEHGHYATPVAFLLAKVYKKSPVIIAEEIAQKLSNIPEFQQVNALNGYLNIFLSTSFFEALIGEVTTNEVNFGKQNLGEGKKILLEYVSANPTGPLHIGHARGAVFGDSLCKVAQLLGYDINTEYYVNDSGSQIGMLGLSIYLMGRESITKLLVEYPEQYYRGEYILDLAYLAEKKFGKGIFEGPEVEAIEILSKFGKELMLVEIKKNLEEAGITIEKFISEKALSPLWEKTFQKLKAGGGISEENKKVWLTSSQYGDEKDRVIVRENGEPTYLAGDVIYHDNKFSRGYDHYINIWGADHHGYIARVRAAIHFLGYDENKLEILLSQMVGLLKGGQPYKMSKRAGNFILMKDIIAEIGADALRFIFLSKKPDTHLEFDIDQLRNQDSSNPVFYINYANARIHTMLEKSSLKKNNLISNASLRKIPKEAQSLLFNALCLPRVIEMAFNERGLQKICEYLKNLAADFHGFYNAQKILETPLEAPLLRVCQVVSLSLTIGLRLLGIQAKIKM